MGMTLPSFAKWWDNADSKGNKCWSRYGKEDWEGGKQESIFSNVYIDMTVGKLKCDVLVWVT